MPETAQSLLEKGTAAIGFLESRLLLEFLTKKTAAQILGFGAEIFISESQKAFWENAIARRKSGEPFFYIVGEVEFDSLIFNVDKNVLIPRPETEELLFTAHDFLKTRETAKVLDLGTGSGILAIALKKRFPKIKITATDISPAALKIAQKNAAQNGVSVEFVESAWFEKITDSFDLIISNPPYIAENDPHLENLKFEPQSALVAKNNGLADLLEIIAESKNHLKKNGALFLEHGHDQESPVQNALKNHGFSNVFTRYDLANFPRVSGGFLR